MKKCPVCGMKVDSGKTAAKDEHMGKTYYFCSDHCKNSFQDNPS